MRVLGSKLSGIQNLHPAYFASVMATGILALASDLISLSTLSQLLTWLNIGLYLTVSLLTAWRITCYPRDFVADLFHHGRCVGFFTTVAATNVLGNQFLVVLELPAFAFGLWCLGIVLWAVTTYGIFSILTIKSAKPGLETGINGGWLVAVVAAQSVSVLGTALSSASVEYAEPMRLPSLASIAPSTTGSRKQCYAKKRQPWPCFNHQDSTRRVATFHLNIKHS